MSAISCKFKCDSILEYSTCFQYTLTPVQGGFANRAFWNATPSGKFEVTVLKTQGKLFEVGKSYLFNITEENE